MSSLLPISATARERALDLALARIAAAEVPIRDLWRPGAVPAELLPWLAWALSVDAWGPDWSEADQRAQTAASVEIHRRKGTPGAIKRVLAALGIQARVVEWWEYGGEPYHFKVEAAGPEMEISEALGQELRNLALEHKNERSVLEDFAVYYLATWEVKVACGAAGAVEDSALMNNLIEAAGWASPGRAAGAVGLVEDSAVMNNLVEAAASASVSPTVGAVGLIEASAV